MEHRTDMKVDEYYLKAFPSRIAFWRDFEWLVYSASIEFEMVANETVSFRDPLIGGQ